MDKQTVLKKLLISLILDEGANGKDQCELVFINLFLDMEYGVEFTEREIGEIIFKTYYVTMAGELVYTPQSETEPLELRNKFWEIVKDKYPSELEEL